MGTGCVARDRMNFPYYPAHPPSIVFYWIQINYYEHMRLISYQTIARDADFRINVSDRR